MNTALGDEGGFATGHETHSRAIKELVSAIENAGYTPEDQVSLALDAAATEFYSREKYDLTDTGEGKLETDQLIDLYASWVDRHPIISIEDGVAEQDGDGWEKLTERLGDRVQIVGDDLFVTNPEFIRNGVKKGYANSALIKPNQVGTLTETCSAVDAAQENGYTAVVSHRSGETEDTSIADLAVGLNCSQIKAGSAARGERVAKYNRVLRIEETLEGSAGFAGSEAFRQLDSET